MMLLIWWRQVVFGGHAQIMVPHTSRMVPHTSFQEWYPVLQVATQLEEPSSSVQKLFYWYSNFLLVLEAMFLYSNTYFLILLSTYISIKAVAGTKEDA